MGTPVGNLIPLERYRTVNRIRELRAAALSSLERNRLKLTHLYQTGEVLTREGTLQGRKLLRRREKLLRGLALADELEGEGLLPPPRRPSVVFATVSKMESLVAAEAQ